MSILNANNTRQTITKRSLQGQQHQLADTFIQLSVLAGQQHPTQTFEPFAKRLQQAGYAPFTSQQTTCLQLNLGKMCNQTCEHCHVDAGPDRKEKMSRQTMQQCIDVLKNNPSITTVDLTGGAHELHPDFRWLVSEITELGLKIMNRCNLTIIQSNPKYYDLPQFFARHKIEVISSLPHYSAARTDKQRGQGVFDDSITSLKQLNAIGYGQPNSGLTLNLVYNPSGAFLPARQAALEREFKQQLQRRFGIVFNNLYVITNMPISRFLNYLLESGNYASYMQKLTEAFNPATISGLMCRNTLSVSWDGFLYDCDFNQMLNLKVAPLAHQHISQFNGQVLNYRPIVVNQHCYGCTAGAGSSCGGETV